MKHNEEALSDLKLKNNLMKQIVISASKGALKKKPIQDNYSFH